MYLKVMGILTVNAVSEVTKAHGNFDCKCILK